MTAPFSSSRLDEAIAIAEAAIPMVVWGEKRGELRERLDALKALTQSETGMNRFSTTRKGDAAMTVRAKFVVQSITTHKAWSGPGLMGTVTLNPVTSGSDENKSFYAATPGGKIELGTVNEEALKQFGIGDEFYVDFTPAPKP